jgi:hypothetical protein
MPVGAHSINEKSPVHRGQGSFVIQLSFFRPVPRIGARLAKLLNEGFPLENVIGNVPDSMLFEKCHRIYFAFKLNQFTIGQAVNKGLVGRLFSRVTASVHLFRELLLLLP